MLLSASASLSVALQRQTDRSRGTLRLRAHSRLGGGGRRPKLIYRQGTHWHAYGALKHGTLKHISFSGRGRGESERWLRRPGPAGHRCECTGQIRRMQISLRFVVSKNIIGASGLFILCVIISFIVQQSSWYHVVNPGDEVIGVLTFHKKEPGFLDQVQATEYVLNGSKTIHQAHIEGMAHQGIWLFIIDRYICFLVEGRPSTVIKMQWR